MEKIILDTDFETDCDDVGALCTLHALEKQGDVEILGVIASVCSPWPAAGVRALNLALGRPGIPVGTNRRIPNQLCYRLHRERMIDRLYHWCMAARYPEAEPGRFHPEEGIDLYRRLLRESEDGSVTICAIGLLTVLAELIETEPELVERKVKHLVCMANGVYPEGNPRFNWTMDPEAAERLLARWPGKITVSAPGEELLTGAELARQLPADNLELLAYRRFSADEPGFRRPSWDQLTVLEAAGVLGDRVKRHRGGRIRFCAASGRHHWEPGRGEHFYLTLAAPAEEISVFIEKYMLEAWK